MKIQKEGNQYLVTADDFVNLQESSKYFFISKKEYNEFVSLVKKELSTMPPQKQLTEFEQQVSNVILVLVAILISLVLFGLIYLSFRFLIII